MIDKQWSHEFLMSEFKKESDRASVILVASLIDESLTTVLRSKLIPVPSATDDLFDGATAPLATFSSKIDMSFRLGLISSRLCRDIHIIRKIRNSFAHDIYNCNFENGSVKSRVMELYNTCEVSSFYHYLVEDKNPKIEQGTRGIFLFISSAILFTINSLQDKVKPLETIPQTVDEVPYLDGNIFVDKLKEGGQPEKK